MPRRWVENTQNGPRFIGGELCQPGEGAWVEDGPYAQPTQFPPVRQNPVTRELVGFDDQPIQGLVSGDGIPPAQFVGDDMSQPARITKPVMTFGKLACRFGAAMWVVTGAGAPTLTQGYTGWDGTGNKTGIVSRTGQPDMLKVVPAAANTGSPGTTEQIMLTSFASNMTTKALAGKFGLWVYVENQPNYGTGGGSGSIALDIGINGDQTSGLTVTFTPSQIREGWNFLVFVMRDPAAYTVAGGGTEYHPYGVLANKNGAGNNSNIKDSPIAYIKISWDNMAGATLYFDSLWTAFSTKAGSVAGCDGGIGLEEIAIPDMKSYDWAYYLAQPYRVWSSGSLQVVDMDGGDSTSVAQMLRLSAMGCDIVNHTINHRANGTLTSEAEIVYEVDMARAWQYEADLWRGSEFYASPQSSTSRLSEKVIKALGFRLQRHARHWNVHPTPFGIDNPHHVGALDISSASAPAYSLTTAGVASSVNGLQQFSKLNRVLDIAEAYGATIFDFWHGITTTGDTGSGEDLTGDNLLISRSAFLKFTAEKRKRELQGSLIIHRGITGFFNGTNAR